MMQVSWNLPGILFTNFDQVLSLEVKTYKGKFVRVKI